MSGNAAPLCSVLSGVVSPSRRARLALVILSLWPDLDRCYVPSSSPREIGVQDAQRVV